MNSEPSQTDPGTQGAAAIVCLVGDLTRFPCRAVVNAANTSLRGGGGVDGALHRAAGPGLLAECIERYPSGCPTGEARLTGGYNLPAEHVIHTPGPIYAGGGAGEAQLLAACHRNALQLAAATNCGTVAFPAISCGVYGYPVEQAAAVAMEAVASALRELPQLEQVTFVLFSEEHHAVFEAARRRRV